MSRISDHLPDFTCFNFLTSKRNDTSRSIKIQTWNAECIHHFQIELNSANIYELLDTKLKADPTTNTMKAIVNKLHDDSNKLLRWNTTIQSKTQL